MNTSFLLKLRSKVELPLVILIHNDYFSYFQNSYATYYYVTNKYSKTKIKL